MAIVGNNPVSRKYQGKVLIDSSRWFNDPDYITEIEQSELEEITEFNNNKYIPPWKI